jgi:hypothetical protein
MELKKMRESLRSLPCDHQRGTAEHGSKPNLTAGQQGSSTAPQLLMYWSVNPGQQTMGTPAQMLSVVEFHPLCVRT